MKEVWRVLFRVILTARELDRVEELLVGQGRAFFHVACAGHESMAALCSTFDAARLAAFALPRQGITTCSWSVGRRVHRQFAMPGGFAF